MLNSSSRTLSGRVRHGTSLRDWRAVAVAVVAALAAAGSALIAAAILLPTAQVLPATILCVVLAAATMALIAWLSPPEVGPSRIVFWDTAGALTLIGLCAALFGEPEQAVALLEQDR